MWKIQGINHEWPLLMWFHLHSLLATEVKMEILREFLESSTIHGLSYISSSKVGHITISFNIYNFHPWNTRLVVKHGQVISFNVFSDQDSKDPLVWHRLSRFHWRRIPHWQVLQGVVGIPYCHLNCHPSHQWPRLPCRVCLSSKGLQHSPLSWSCKRWQFWRNQKSIETISFWDLHGSSPQEICE